MLTIDKTPSMADVISGAVKRPREKRDGESFADWLADSVLADELDVSELVSVNRQFKRFTELDMPYLFQSGVDLIAVNPDATRYAIEYRSSFVVWELMRDHIAAHIEHNGITQTEIARLTGLTQQRVSMILGGKVTPQIDVVIRLCDAIGLKLELVKKR